MKKLLGMLMLSITVFASGCSGVEDVTNGLNYVNEATDYVADIEKFANEVPGLAEKAVNNLEVRTQLEDLLTEMKSDIQEFDVLKAPSMLEDVHNQIVESNAALEEKIDTYLTAIEDGNVTSELLSKIGLEEAVSVYTDLLEQIQKLDQ